MPSLADRARRTAEHAARAVALAALTTLLWRAVRPPLPAAVEVASTAIERDLARWTVTGPGAVHVRLDAVPDTRVRDWLRALTYTGTRASWSSSRAIGPSAIVSEPTVEPDGGTRVRLAAAT